MWLTLKLPQTVSEPHGNPHCPYCESPHTRFYEKIMKKVKHPHLRFVCVTRRKCKRCGRTFRHYAPGVSRSTQTTTVKTLSVLLYSIGLSYGRIVSVLGHFGIRVARSTIWRNVRPMRRNTYYLHALSKKGQLKIAGIPASSVGTGDTEVLASLVGGLLEGRDLEVKFSAVEGRRVWRNTLADTVKKRCGSLGEKERIVRSRRTESISLREDRTVFHLRRNIRRRCLSLSQEARNLMKVAKGERERLQELVDDCEAILHIAEDRNNDCETEFWEIYKKYAWAKAPQKGATATLWYRMRLFTLRLWDRSSRILKRVG